VFVDGGAFFNIIPLTTLKKLGKRQEELIPTYMKMTNFSGEATRALRIFITKITIGPKTMHFAFFIVDVKPSYSMLLGRDWIHSSQCVPFALHQQLMFFEGDQVTITSVDICPFSVDVRMAKTLFYSLYLAHVQVLGNYEEGTWESYNLTKKGFIINWQAKAQPSIEFMDG